MYSVGNSVLLCCWFLLLCTNAIPLPSSQYGIQNRQIGSTPPKEDPFYNTTEAPQSQPGTIVTYRKVPAPIAALSLIPVAMKDAFQIKYTTTDSHGNPTVAMTTVLIPLLNTDYGKLLSYQVAEDASFLNCAPSYALQFLSESGGVLGTTLTQAEIVSISAALLEGWVVTIPDHGGPKAAFLAQTMAGHATLDAIRATLNSAQLTGVDKGAKVAMWGYSGGSDASAFAAELQPSYAPDLNGRIVGTALGGTVPNITAAVPLIDKSTSSGLIPAGILGLAHEYPEVAALVQDPSVVKAESAAEFMSGDDRCLIANLLHFAGQSIFERYFVNPDFNAQTTLIRYFEANGLGQAIPKSPIFLYKSVGDTLSDIADTDKLYNTYCGGGTSVEYQRDLISEHTTLFVTGIPAAFSYLRDRLNSKPLTAGCSRKNVATSLADTGDIIPQQVLSALEQIVRSTQ